jgi:hypothetical protein
MIVGPASKSAGRSAASSIVRPPPIGGWNARDPVSAIKDSDALWLENLIPRSDGLHLRLPRELWRSLAGTIQSLMVWAGPAGPKLFAATPSTITDVTAQGGATSPSVTGLTNGYWSSALLTNPGGAWLMACNGADGVRVFDGTTWVTAAIIKSDMSKYATLDATKFASIAIHMRRPFLVEKNSLRLWYLDSDAYQGTATLLDLAPFCRKGGSLVAVASLTTDGGRNANDRLVAVTSEGELIAYQGVDPRKADSWGLVGVFDVPKPLGRRCFLKLGGDLALLTRGGLLPVSAVLPSPRAKEELVGITDKIRTAFWASAAAVGENDAWGLVASSNHNLTVINVPGPTVSVQLVQAADVDGWCLFSGFDALAWAEMGDDLFYGDRSGSIYRYGAAYSAGTPISAVMISGYSKLGTSARKSFKRARPIFQGLPAAKPVFAMLTDYLKPPISYASGIAWTGSAALLSTIAWPADPAAWDGFDATVASQWRGIAGRGSAGALVMALKAAGPVIYEGAEIAFETGGGI